jgi:hypothetical protein
MFFQFLKIDNRVNLAMQRRTSNVGWQNYYLIPNLLQVSCFFLWE